MGGLICDGFASLAPVRVQFINAAKSMAIRVGLLEARRLNLNQIREEKIFAHSIYKASDCCSAPWWLADTVKEVNDLTCSSYCTSNHVLA